MYGLQCAYIPLDCAPYAYLMERVIEDFKQTYGKKGHSYECLYNPDKPFEVVLTNTNNDFGFKYLHFIVWPAVVIGLCFVSIFTAYSICGCKFRKRTIILFHCHMPNFVRSSKCSLGP